MLFLVKNVRSVCTHQEIFFSERDEMFLEQIAAECPIMSLCGCGSATSLFLRHQFRNHVYQMFRAREGCRFPRIRPPNDHNFAACLARSLQLFVYPAGSSAVFGHQATNTESLYRGKVLLNGEGPSPHDYASLRDTGSSASFQRVGIGQHPYDKAQASPTGFVSVWDQIPRSGGEEYGAGKAECQTGSVIVIVGKEDRFSAIEG